MKVFLITIFLGLTVMADSFSEVKEFDQIQVVESGHCQIRQSTRVLKGNVEIAKTYHRWAIEPNGDLKEFDSRVQAICKAAWTPEVIKKFQDRQKKNLADLGLK